MESWRGARGRGALGPGAAGGDSRRRRRTGEERASELVGQDWTGGELVVVGRSAAASRCEKRPARARAVRLWAGRSRRGARRRPPLECSTMGLTGQERGGTRDGQLGVEGAGVVVSVAGCWLLAGLERAGSSASGVDSGPELAASVTLTRGVTRGCKRLDCCARAPARPRPFRDRLAGCSLRPTNPVPYPPLTQASPPSLSLAPAPALPPMGASCCKPEVRLPRFSPGCSSPRPSPIGSRAKGGRAPGVKGEARPSGLCSRPLRVLVVLPARPRLASALARAHPEPTTDNLALTPAAPSLARRRCVPPPGRPNNPFQTRPCSLARPSPVFPPFTLTPPRYTGDRL